MDWSKFEPTDFEYDFERDELFAHKRRGKETASDSVNVYKNRLCFFETTVH
jgi:hypothetical protein